MIDRKLATSGLNILVVDDEPNIVEALNKFLEGHQINPTQVNLMVKKLLEVRALEQKSASTSPWFSNSSGSYLFGTLSETPISS
ncbi:MAG: hypothetical protein L0Y56_13745 [Nitrospira sp.]|nr:hypothetical protein [Nitrospira sp.]